MSKQKPLSIYSGFIWILLAGALTNLSAQNSSHASLEFKHRDRIVFLGNSLFENELAHGYIEFALTSRWPEADLIFRNLGWTGDNVYAEARSTFSTPPTAYQQLFQQIKTAAPNYVFIAYGGIESQKGEEGIDEFIQGLESIIDSVDAFGAETVLLSTLPVKMAGNIENTELQNRNLKRYSEAIRQLANKRKKRFADLYTSIENNKADLFLENGIHLNDYGYYYLAKVLEKELGWNERGERIVVQAGGNQASVTAPAKLIPSEASNIRFSIQEKLLPYPAPAEIEAHPETSVTIQINGLKKGIYTLYENDRQLFTAPGSDWAKGITLAQGASFIQSDKIREYIVKKNDLFFQQYRPLNRTYILGFRAYEQGRHKQGLQDLDYIITWLEGQISLHRKPTPKIYELRLVK